MSALDVKTQLDTLGTLGTLLIGGLPPSPDVIGAIHEYAGPPPEGQFGVVGIGFETPAIQIIFRGEPDDYETPMNRARIAWAHLAGLQPGELTVGSVEYLMFKPQQSPFSLGKDENRRYEIACNYYVMKELF